MAHQFLYPNREFPTSQTELAARGIMNGILSCLNKELVKLFESQA